MGRKEDDIFKKLNKQTPLAKRKDISPLSSGDFRKTRNAEPLRYSATPKRTTSPSGRGAELASRYNQRQSPPSAPRQGLTVFGEEEDKMEVSRPARKPVVRAATPPPPRASARSTSQARGEHARRVDSADSMQAEIEQTSKRASGTRSREAGASHSETATGRQAGTRRPAASRDAMSSGQDLHEGRSFARPEPGARVRPPREKDSIDVFTDHVATPAHARAYGQIVTAQTAANRETEKMPESVDNGMSFRHELKYYINYYDYMLLKSSLKSLLSLDSNAGPDGDYHIRSLYFDDVYETALSEKIAGYDTRNKYRIRIYDFSDNVIKFEKKMKRGQYIAKADLLISRDECDALISGDCQFLEGRTEPLAGDIYLQMKNNLLRPRVIVDYYREAYVSPFGNVRITFDKDIKAGLWLTDIFNPDAPTMSVLEPGTMVLEVKFNRYLPPFIKSVLNNVNAAERSAVSKYVLCRKYE